MKKILRDGAPAFSSSAHRFTSQLFTLSNERIHERTFLRGRLFKSPFRERKFLFLFLQSERTFLYLKKKKCN